MDKTPEKQTEQQSAECHPKDRAGEIHLILGSMYSGKTTELIRRYNKYSRTDKKCLLIRFAEDIRYDKTKLCTHDLYKMDAMSETLIANIYEKIITEHYEVVCIDEGQFFVDIVQFAEVLANCGVIVIISGLDGNYKREAFATPDGTGGNQTTATATATCADLTRLVPKSEEVVKLTAICSICKKDGASFTKRTVNTGSGEKQIGGNDMYIAVCRKCYFS